MPTALQDAAVVRLVELLLLGGSLGAVALGASPTRHPWVRWATLWAAICVLLAPTVASWLPPTSWVLLREDATQGAVQHLTAAPYTQWLIHQVVARFMGGPDPSTPIELATGLAGFAALGPAAAAAARASGVGPAASLALGGAIAVCPWSALTGPSRVGAGLAVLGLLALGLAFTHRRGLLPAFVGVAGGLVAALCRPELAAYGLAAAVAATAAAAGLAPALTTALRPLGDALHRRPDLAALGTAALFVASARLGATELPDPMSASGMVRSLTPLSVWVWGWPLVAAAWGGLGLAVAAFLGAVTAWRRPLALLPALAPFVAVLAIQAGAAHATPGVAPPPRADGTGHVALWELFRYTAPHLPALAALAAAGLAALPARAQLPVALLAFLPLPMAMRPFNPSLPPGEGPGGPLPSLAVESRVLGAQLDLGGCGLLTLSTLRDEAVLPWAWHALWRGPDGRVVHRVTPQEDAPIPEAAAAALLPQAPCVAVWRSLDCDARGAGDACAPLDALPALASRTLSFRRIVHPDHLLVHPPQVRVGWFALPGRPAPARLALPEGDGVVTIDAPRLAAPPDSE